jgi:hypothetical protein
MNAGRWPFRIGLLLSAFLLLGVGCWLFYLAAFNLWAAGGPPTPNPELYAGSGWVCLAVSIVCLGTGAWVSMRALRKG